MSSRGHLAVAVLLASVLVGPAGSSVTTAGATEAVFKGPVPSAACGRGSLPETGLQGQVPLADRNSGRSALGYRCNLELIGQYQGEGASWVNQSYRHCAYMATRFPGSTDSPGVQVIDVSDPTAPSLAGTLTSSAMVGPWESLKVNQARGLLAAVIAPSPAGNGVGYFDVYDIKSDCTKPRLLSSTPSNVLGHEGDWAPDGRTYWATSAYGGGVTAIDVADPARPTRVFSGNTSVANHGLAVSDDGNRLYIARVGEVTGTVTGGHVHLPGEDNGLEIFDVSRVQSRAPAPQIHRVGLVYWTDGAIGQHALRITYADRPYLAFVDEYGAGAARIIDITDEVNPTVVSKLKLEIHLPENGDTRAADTSGTGIFGYEGHYCAVDQFDDPTALACGYFQSGVRVFDIRDPRAPREIAYYNPPAQSGKNAELNGSEHAGDLGYGDGTTAQLTADWCSSPPRFVGSDQLWVTCQDNGFLALRFTNNAYPIRRTTR